MAFITIYREDDPSVTRKVSEDSFRRWPKGTSPGSKEGGRNNWYAVDESAPPVEPRKPRVPDVIERVMASKAEPPPDQNGATMTAADTVRAIMEADTAEAVDVIAAGDERLTVIAAVEKRKAQLARQ